METDKAFMIVPLRFLLSSCMHLLVLVAAGCGFQVQTIGTSSVNTVSGVVKPFIGSIAYQQSKSLISNAYASICTEDVYARLYELSADGSIDTTQPLMSQKLEADARYTFDLSGLSHSNRVRYLVRAEGCNGDILARPVTALNNMQDIDAATTTVSQVINLDSLISKKLNEATKQEVESLIKTISSTNISSALNSLTNNSSANSKFIEIFGAPATIITNAHPDVAMLSFSSQLSELTPFTFSSRVLHIDPGYSFAYVWKLNGAVVATTKNFTFTPHSNQQGQHQIDYYVGKNDGNGNIDLNLPYYVRSFDVMVANTIPPMAPVISVNSSTPSPVNSNSIVLDIATGIALADCGTFSSMAITESPTSPGPLQFTLNCEDPITQSLSVNFTPGDGTKTLYLWVRDSEGQISAPRQVSFVLDTTPPTVSIGAFSALTNDNTPTFTLTAADTHDVNFTCRINSEPWFNCSSLLTTHSLTDGPHTLSVVGTDVAGNSSPVTTSDFTIDTTLPQSLTISLHSAQITNNSSISISISDCEDSTHVLASTSSTTPTLATPNWIPCTTIPGAVSVNTSGDGSKTINLWSRDAAGNINTAGNQLTVVLDTTAPTITSGPTTASLIQGGSNQTISWNAIDSNVTKISIEYYNGSTWTNIASDISNTGALLWSVPFSDTSSAKLRLIATDAANNSSSQDSPSFSVDSTAPMITHFELANGAVDIAMPTVSFEQTSSDNLSAITHIRFSENPTYSNSNWLTIQSSGTITLSAISGAKTVYAWVKDAAGNVSNASQYSLALDYGAPPVVSITSPSSSSGPFVGGSDVVPISWTCSSANGLAAEPIRLKYTTNDGTTFQEVTSGWIQNNLSPVSGSYNWSLPSGVTTFRILVECKSVAGVIASSFSSPVNTSGWSIFAGDPAYMNEDINANLALMTTGAAGFQSMAADSSGNIYFMKGNVLMKVDSLSGLVTRFAGDPNSSGCNITAGQDPLNSSSNRIGNAFLYGSTPDGLSLILGSCSKIWFINTLTRSVSLAYNASIGWPAFLNRTGFLYYFSANRLFRLNLNLATPTPEHIYGNGTCSATTPSIGSEATSDAVVARSSNNDCSENYMFVNENDTEFWTGCWNNWGCAASRKYVFDSTTSTFKLASSSLGWSFQDWNIGVCTTSHTYPRVWCNSRYNTNQRVTFNLNTETWEPRPALSSSVFIRYTPTPSGMASLRSDNLLTAHIENSDGTITEYQMGGSNIETYGNGNDRAKIAFSGVQDISYSATTGNLLVRTAAGLRNIAMSSWPNTNTTTPVWNSPGASQNRITQNASGTRVLILSSWCGLLGFNSYTYSSGVLNPESGFYNLLGCNSGTSLPHPIANNTNVTGNNFAWVNRFGGDDRPLLHSNGKQYFFVKNGTSDGVLYSSDKIKVNWIAGRAGTTGFDSADNGNTAATAQLRDIRWITEVTNGDFAGDLLILDGYRMRLITITTESTSPKIYDILNLEALVGFPTGSPAIVDVAYDNNSELFDGTTTVPGSGKIYFSTSTNRIFSVTPISLSGFTVSSATLSEYTFFGTSLTGSNRLALTPAGLLVTQPSKNRILRVAP